MSPQKQELLDAIATAPDEAINEMLLFLKGLLQHSTPPEPNPKRVVGLHLNMIKIGTDFDEPADFQVN
jgi:Protein of unknown function (DUF2281)